MNTVATETVRATMRFCPNCGWYYPRVDLPYDMCENPNRSAA